MHPTRLLLATLLTVPCTLAWQGEASPVGGAAPAASHPNDACIDCHAGIVESYAKSGMARALLPLEGFDPKGLGTTTDPAGFRYRFEGSGKSTRIVEEVLGKEGELVALHSVPLVFRIGAGIFDTAFAANVGEQLFFAPLEVVSAHAGGERHAQLSPKHMSKGGLRFDSPAPEDCLACHTDQLPPRGYPSHAKPPSDWPLVSITCLACHGDGEAHRAWREAELAGRPPPTPDPILAPAKLSVIERLSICARCHLQGDARVSLERKPTSVPGPGGDFLDRMAVWIARDETDDIGFVSHTERMVLSRCFTESQARGPRAMVCETCHDPHRTLFEPREGRRVRDACTSCHPSGAARGAEQDSPCKLAPEARQGSDCVSCHMRRTPTFDVAGVEIHDHWIRREAIEPSKFAKVRGLQSNGGLVRRFAWPGKTPALSADPGLEMMGLAAVGQGKEAVKLLDRPASKAMEALPAFHTARGMLHFRQRQFEQAEVAFQRSLALDPDQPGVRVNQGFMLIEQGRHREALALFEELTARFPRAEILLRNRATAKAGLGDLAGARADLAAAQAILPRAEGARILADLSSRLGLSADVARWKQEADKLEPIRR